jgi:HPt (histidine-containing phosphotransfer) domain-containing protein
MADQPNQDLDLSLLNEIADGSDEFIVESIDMFLQQTPEILEAIAAGLSADDLLAAGGAAHKLKATLGFFGMLNTQALIQQIETACKTGSESVAEISAKFDQAKAIISANLPQLEQLRADAQSRI